MKKNLAEKWNCRMAELINTLAEWRDHVRILNGLLERIELDYKSYKKRNVFPPTTTYLGEDEYTIVRVPDDTLMLVRRRQHSLYCLIATMKNEDSYDELPLDPLPVPTTWKEVEELRHSMKCLLIELQNETYQARKLCVKKMTEYYIKKFDLKVINSKNIHPKYLKVKSILNDVEKQRFYLTCFKYDYASKKLCGVDDKGLRMPAVNLMRY